jgi:hypothetical protein
VQQVIEFAVLNSMLIRLYLTYVSHSKASK